MKTWQHILLGIFIGMILTAAVLLVALPPRGTPVELLPAPTPAPIVIHISGAVRQPGVFSITRSSRVEDAIEAAGGLTGDADPMAINMAARLRDGEKIHVPAIGEAPPTPSHSSEAGSSTENLTGALVNINTGTLEELQTLPGIGETRAREIIAYREANGDFKTIDEIMDVSGIGSIMFERMKDLITVE